MKKILILFFTLILLSGCSIDYTLEFKDFSIDETLEYTVSENEYNNYNNSLNETINKNIYEFFEYQPILAFNDNYQLQHNVEKNSIANGLYLKYTYDYNYNNFNKSYILQECFNNYSILNEDEYYYVSVKGKMDCYYNDINIKIKSTKKVMYNNANKYKDGYLIWNINSNNKDDVDIVFQISKTEANDGKESERFKKSKTNVSTYLLTIIVLIVIILTIVFYISYRKKHNN